ncbi:MAG: DUF971 domain-containing protein [Gammaproteobacteria bacterium]|nr:DUF971 domain-containing protein [Gammaproteobacteria bacterium]
MSEQTTPTPTEINLHQKSRELEIAFDDGSRFHFSSEFLRVNSPSAEVRGHAPGEETLQVGKENVNIKTLEPVGSYAVKIVFTDGHDSGIFSWELFYNYGQNQEKIWQDYLQKLKDAGHERKLN